MTVQKYVKRSLDFLILGSLVTVFISCGNNLMPKNTTGFSIELPSTNTARNPEGMGVGQIKFGVAKYGAVATWKISGTSPTTDLNFTKVFPGNAKIAVIEDLKPGDWDIAMVGRDTGDVQVFYATTSCTLVSGENKLVIKMKKDPTAIATMEVSRETGELVNSEEEVHFDNVASDNLTTEITLNIKNPTGNSDLVFAAILEQGNQGFSIPQPTKPVSPLAAVPFTIYFTFQENQSEKSRTDTLKIFSNDPTQPIFVLN